MPLFRKPVNTTNAHCSSSRTAMSNRAIKTMQLTITIASWRNSPMLTIGRWQRSNSLTCSAQKSGLQKLLFNIKPWLMATRLVNTQTMHSISWGSVITKPPLTTRISWLPLRRHLNVCFQTMPIARTLLKPITVWHSPIVMQRKNITMRKNGRSSFRLLTKLTANMPQVTMSSFSRHLDISI